jgi:predicted peptidase
VIGKIKQTIALRFMLYLPAEYGQDAARRWPVILYLHGRGESGPDLNLLLRQPLPELLDADPKFPFIVISPQLTGPGSTTYDISGNPQDYMQAWGWNGWYKRLNMLLDYVQDNYAVDEGRVYLTGISLGGFGAWNYALRFPERFAAVVPIAGGYHYANRDVPENICDLAGMGVWAFHGDEDTTISPFQSEVMVDALKPCGGEIHLTIYPGVAHEAWQLAYRDDELWEWLLAHTLEP